MIVFGGVGHFQTRPLSDTDYEVGMGNYCGGTMWLGPHTLQQNWFSGWSKYKKVLPYRTPENVSPTFLQKCRENFFSGPKAQKLSQTMNTMTILDALKELETL